MMPTTASWTPVLVLILSIFTGKYRRRRLFLLLMDDGIEFLWWQLAIDMVGHSELCENLKVVRYQY